MSNRKFMAYLPSDKIYQYQPKDIDVFSDLEILRDFLTQLKQTKTYSTDIHNAVTSLETALLNLDRFRQIRHQRYGLLDWTISEQHDYFQGFGKFTQPLDVVIKIVSQQLNTETNQIEDVVYATFKEEVRPSNFIPFFLELLHYNYPEQGFIVKEQPQTNDKEVVYHIYTNTFYANDKNKIETQYRDLLNRIDSLYQANSQGDVTIINYCGNDKDLKFVNVSFGKDRVIESFNALSKVYTKLSQLGYVTVQFDHRPGLLFVFDAEEWTLDEVHFDLKQSVEEVSKFPPLADFNKLTK